MTRHHPQDLLNQEVPFIASGAIIPVSDYLDLMPNFKAKAAKWNMAADLDTLRQDDGRFYVLPGMHEEIWSTTPSPCAPMSSTSWT